MKRTNPALEMAGTATSARACALPGITTMPGVPSAIRSIDLAKKRNGFNGTFTGAPARRQRSFTT
jgi:hypothetical protein